MGAELHTVLTGPVLDVAPRLLGATLRHGEVAVRLTEVEAYGGVDDPGSHAHRGRTPRNEIMFGPPGFLYVYFTYGMHYCCNVVTGRDSSASAVLLRAGEIVAGLDLARERRPGAADRDLARGPARLCRALAIDLTQNHTDLSRGPVILEMADPLAPERIRSGPRVGLRLAAEQPWRFWIDGEPSVSRYTPAKPRIRKTP